MRIPYNTNHPLEVLVDIEAAMSQLYTVYADRFAECADVWFALSAEEVNHARWVRVVLADIHGGQLSMQVARLSATPLQEILDTVKGHIMTAEEGDVTLEQAVATSLSLEQSLVDLRLFDSASEDSPEVQRVFAELAACTQRHAEQITSLQV